MFTLGKRSRQELVGVHPDLVLVVERALEMSPIDFSVIDGLRTVEEQQIFVAQGVSKTMKSRHVEGCAVDLAPYVGNKVRWEWPLVYKVALAVRRASASLEIPIRWGGVWDCARMNELPATLEGLRQAVSLYAKRRKAKNKGVFLDGPHFELPRDIYPDAFVP